MTRNRREITRPAPELDEGEWLYVLLAPVRERIRQQPSPLAVLRIRRRIWREITRRSLPLVAA